MEFDATFLIAAISFIIFIFLMNKIFYAPILKIMQERQTFVEQNYENAKLINQETQEKIEYREAELNKSRTEVQTMISENSKKLKKESSEKIAQYKNELYENIKNEKDSLKNSAIGAKEILKENVVDIAKNISTKLLGDSINIETINKDQIKE